MTRTDLSTHWVSTCKGSPWFNGKFVSCPNHPPPEVQCSDATCVHGIHCSFTPVQFLALEQDLDPSVQALCMV